MAFQILHGLLQIDGDLLGFALKMFVLFVAVALPEDDRHLGAFHWWPQIDQSQCRYIAVLVEQFIVSAVRIEKMILRLVI